MPTITPVSNQYANALSSGMASLTPGAIMLLLRRRMGDMDGQISSIMGEIEANTAQSEKIQERVEAMTAIKAAMANQQPEGDDPIKLGDIEVTWKGETMSAADLLNRMGIVIDRTRDDSYPTLEHQEYLLDQTNRDIRAMEEGPPSALRDNLINGLKRKRTALESHIEHIPSAYQSDTITGSSLSASIDQTQSEGRRMNSGNEVLMVRMQSAMQQRSQAVTMATQMLKSINDSSNSIAQNIGR